MGFNLTMMKRVGSLLLLLWLLLLAMGLMKALEVLSSIFSSWRTFTSRRLAANPPTDCRQPRANSLVARRSVAGSSRP